MIEITNKTKSKFPHLLFSEITDAVLGKDYDLSLVFIGATRSRTLNKKWRGKDKSANILSFPLSDDSGEILIDLATARIQAPQFDRKFKNYIYFLFIHGTTHLKGYSHGSTMEGQEEKIRKKFNI